MRDNAEVNRHIAAQTALGRVGLPDDIGDAIAALLSDELCVDERAACGSLGRDVPLILTAPSL
ncbi:SDR family oxidoreductase [Klebsiella pneumoniae subsp. pneumoniae]|nr:SDR family oxidoreductase [Klebsiella pneumoniae subsp. pneumoniae]